MRHKKLAGALLALGLVWTSGTALSRLWALEAGSATETTSEPENIPVVAQDKTETPIQAKSALPGLASEKAPAAAAPLAEVKGVGYVAPLDNLLAFYRQELGDAEKVIARWNSRAEKMMKTEKELMDEVQSLQREMDQKQKEDAKRYKREVKQIDKRIKQLEKSHKGLKKEMAGEAKELAKELKLLAKDIQGAVSDKYDQVAQEVMVFNKE